LLSMLFYYFYQQETDGPASVRDKLAAKGQGKVVGRAAKQRAIARGDNMAPAQVGLTGQSCINSKTGSNSETKLHRKSRSCL